MNINKEERLNTAYSQLLEIKSRISKSDEHAIKCAKLGLSFAELYPDEATEYQQAIAAYNAKEVEIANIQAEPDEDETIDRGIELEEEIV